MSHQQRNILRIWLAVAVWMTPLGAVRASEPRATDYLTPHSLAAVTVRLADVAATPWVRRLPVEMLEAATEDFLGLPLETIDRVTAFVEPPMGASPQYAIVLQATAPISFDRFRYELTDHTKPGELLGRPLMESQSELAPSLCLLDDQTLAIGPKMFLKRLVRGADSSGSPIEVAMRESGGDDNQLHAALLLGPLQPLMPVFLMGAKQEAPPETHRFLDALPLFNRVILAANLDGRHESSLKVYANDREAADQLEALLADGLTLLREQMERDDQLAELRNHEEAVARAWVSYLERMMEEQAEAATRLREGDDLFVLGRTAPGDSLQPQVMLAVSGVLVALLLPAVQAAREAARRNQSLSNTQQLGLAMLNYHDVKDAFPAHAIYSDAGEPLLSWRVAILPFVEQPELYHRFRLDEPWDSPHNLPLMSEMPDIYFDHSSRSLSVDDGKTHYLGVVGPRSAFSGGRTAVALDSISDGPAQTLLVVQVDDQHAVEWTKPVDYDAEQHAANPFAGIGSLHPGVFLGAFADGHGQALPIDFDPAKLRGLMTTDGRESIRLP